MRTRERGREGRGYTRENTEVPHPPSPCRMMCSCRECRIVLLSVYGPTKQARQLALTTRVDPHHRHGHMAGETMLDGGLPMLPPPPTFRAPTRDSVLAAATRGKRSSTLDEDDLSFMDKEVGGFLTNQQQQSMYKYGM